MKYASYNEKGTAIALGSFDGVHKGHCRVIMQAVASPYLPVALVINSKFTLSTKEETCALINSLASGCLFEDFDYIKGMDCTEFVHHLKEKYLCRMIACGENFRLGKNRAYDVRDLKRACEQAGVDIEIVPMVKSKKENISSSAIRAALQKGDIAAFKEMTGRSFSLTSTVIDGDGRGRTMGLPTINQKPDTSLVLPPFGVWATVCTAGGAEYQCVTNLGVRPTFPLDEPVAETFIMNYSGNLYGKKISVRFCAFIREEKKFENREELKKQIEDDIQIASKLLCDDFA